MKYRIKVWTPVAQNENDIIFNDITEALSQQLELEAAQPQNIYEIVPILAEKETSYYAAM